MPRRLLLAPGGERLQPAEHLGLAARDPDPLPGQSGVVLVIGRVGEPLHLLVEPFAAPGAPKPLEHLGEQGGEMGDVADRIVDLAPVERPPAPVGEARALVEALADQALDQVGIADLLAEPERHRRDLGVEQRMRRPAGDVVDDLDILASGVEDLEHVLIVDQQVEQGRHVEPFGLGVDGGGLVDVADLDQAQVRPIGVLAHEFGVDGDERRLGPDARTGTSANWNR